MSAASPGPGFQEHLQKGLSLYKAGRWDEAVLALREAVLADPAAAEARRFLGLALAASHYNLGIRLEAKGLYGEAIAAFERFLTLAPTDAQRQVEAVRKRVAELRLLAAQRAPAARQETKAGPDIGWEPGNVIDGLYEVKSQLGVGGFGSVHKVYHRGWGLDLAVKSPRADRVSNRRALERFVQEANTWVGLGLHPHIVACFFVRLMGVPRIFIEYMEGGSLWDWLQDGRVKDAGTALDIAVQIARAMEYAHGRGLVHRDLKPGNCLMTPGGTLKVTDFGLAKVGVEEDEEPGADAAPHGARIARVREATQTGRLGTPEYMAPEQWRKAKEAGAGADAWAFGVILNQLFRGSKPFQISEGEPLDAFYDRQVKSNWSFDKPAGLPSGVSELLSMCLTPDPAKRLADFKRIGAVLESAYEKAAGQAYPREGVKKSPLLADTMMNQGVSMADLGRTDEALRLFEEALKLDPTHPGALYDQGLLLIEAGKLTEAALLTRLAESKKARPGEWTASYLLGLVQLRRRDAPAALKELEEAVGASHGNLLVTAAQAKARAGAFEPAAGLFVTLPRGTESAQMEEGAFRTLLSRAEAEADAGEPGKACETLKKARTMKGYERHPVALEVGRRLGSRGVRSGLRAGWQRRVFEDSGGALALAATPDGGRLLSGHPDQTMRLWEIGTGRCLRAFKGYDGAVNCVCASLDGRFGAAGSAKGALKLWELGTGRDCGLLARHSGAVRLACLSPDGRTSLSVGEEDDGILLREIATDKPETLAGHGGPVRSLCFSADGRLVLSAGEDKTLRLWAIASRKCVKVITGHDRPVRSACLTPDGASALSVDSAGALRLWELASGRCVKTVAQADSRGACLTPEGRFALSLGEGRTLDVWEFPRGLRLASLAGHTEVVTSVCAGWDGSFAFTAGTDAIRCWELDWDYSFPNRRDWDEGARPCVESFLAVHGLAGDGAAGWSSERWGGLFEELGRRGYGWLNHAGVRSRVKALGMGAAEASKRGLSGLVVKLAAAAAIAAALAAAWSVLRGGAAP